MEMKTAGRIALIISLFMELLLFSSFMGRSALFSVDKQIEILFNKSRALMFHRFLFQKEVFLKGGHFFSVSQTTKLKAY